MNIGKTKIVIFGARKLPNLQFKIGSECIEIVKNHKYLGIIFFQTGSFHTARKHIVQQAK